MEYCLSSDASRLPASAVEVCARASFSVLTRYPARTEIAKVAQTRTGAKPFNTIKNTLKEESSKHNDHITVVLKVDRDISVEQMIKVVDIVNQLKISLVVATER